MDYKKRITDELLKIKLEAFEYVPKEKIEQYKSATFKVLDVQKH